MRFLLLALVLFCGNSFAAARYFVSGGVDNNWSTTGNWSLTDGGAGGQTVPSSSDDVHFTSNSPNCTVNTSNRAALSLDFTGYTNTITMSVNISVSGSVTLAAGMTVSGSGTLIILATSTLTSNGKTWPNPMTLNVTATITLADNWTVGGLFSLGASGSPTLSGNTMTLNGGLRHTGTSNSLGGTTVLKLAATSTVDAPSITSGRINSPITIDAGSGTITITSVMPVDFGQVKLVSGTVTTTAGTWTAVGGSGGQRVYSSIR